MPEQANNFFAMQPEPERSCLLYLRRLVLDHPAQITEAWKFNTPFYYYKKRWLCFISYDKKTKVIYLSFVNGYKMEHPKLLSEGRKKMKIYYVDAAADMDVTEINTLLDLSVEIQKSLKK